jgi:hypothetical protein
MRRLAALGLRLTKCAAATPCFLSDVGGLREGFLHGF